MKGQKVNIELRVAYVEDEENDIALAQRDGRYRWSVVSGADDADWDPVVHEKGYAHTAAEAALAGSERLLVYLESRR